jgi:iron complex transport system substrate-binding protein
MVKIDRRTFCAGLVLSPLTGISPASSAALSTVTDMTDRKVQIPAQPKRIVLLEARDIVTMALLHPNPAALIVGWAATDRIDSNILLKQLQGNQKIEIVGKQTPDTMSIEGLISLSPDLVVANLFMAPQGEKDLLVERLENAGIAVIFSEQISNSNEGQPAKHSIIESFRDHVRMWGKILDAETRAADYIGLFDKHLNRIKRRLADATPVTTYLEVQSTTDDCCWAAGKQVWGELLTLGGGQTLPGVTAPWYQKLQLEYLLSTPFDVYIASGGGWSSGGRPAIGTGIDHVEGREGLKRLTQRTGFGQLASVRSGRVHGIWTGLISVPPLNILFIELVAKWLHPDLCADIDPDATLSEINRRFFKTPLGGPLWVSLQD